MTHWVDWAEKPKHKQYNINNGCFFFVFNILKQKQTKIKKKKVGICLLYFMVLLHSSFDVFRFRTVITYFTVTDSMSEIAEVAASHKLVSDFLNLRNTTETCIGHSVIKAKIIISECGRDEKAFYPQCVLCFQRQFF